MTKEPEKSELSTENGDDRIRADLLPPHHIVDPVHPDGWAPIPTTTVPDACHLENVLKVLWARDAMSWISPDGRRYIVPGRYNRDTAVTVTTASPTDWECNCQQSHETEYLCYPVLQVAILRGDLIRRQVG